MRLLRLLSFLRLLRLLSPPFSFVSFFLLSHISLLSGSREIIERLRYYKLWGFLSTKGITDLRYIPNLWINHFLKDDCLLISYSGKIEEHPDSIGFEKYSGVDERVLGNEILHVLKGARMFSQYDIAPIIELFREKQRILIENYPDEFGPHKWSFDLDEWMAEEYLSGRPTYYSKAITEKRDAELRELYDKRGQTNG